MTNQEQAQRNIDAMNHQAQLSELKRLSAYTKRRLMQLAMKVEHVRKGMPKNTPQFRHNELNEVRNDLRALAADLYGDAE